MHRYAVAVTAVMSAGTAMAADVPANNESVAELKAMVTDLQKQVDSLKAQNSENWLTEHRSQEIRGLVQDVLADADTRASLLQGGAMAGWDKNFFIMSGDGNYKLNIYGQLQVRYVYNHQNDSPTDDNRAGFEVRRAKVGFKGNVVDPSWTYDVLMAADPGTGNFQLDDNGWIMKDLENGFKIKVGQMKAPYLREEVLSSTRLFAVERSLVTSFFTAGTVQGVQVGWEGDKVHAYGQYNDGNNSKNTTWSTEDTEFSFAGRAEYLVNGEWKNMQDYDSFKDEGSGLVVGAAFNWSKQENGTGTPAAFNNAEVDNFGFTADATFKFGGASLAGALMYRKLETDTGSPADIDLDQWGFFVRGGYFITDSWELYAQYEWGDVDISGSEDLSVITVGATKYWAKHGLKWQSDFGYGLNEVTSFWANNNAGWRADAPGEDGQIVIRSQIQLLF